MNLYDFFLGFLFFWAGFLLIIREISNSKKSFGVFKIQLIGGFLIFIMLGAYLIYSELKKIL